MLRAGLQHRARRLRPQLRRSTSSGAAARRGQGQRPPASCMPGDHLDLDFAMGGTGPLRLNVADAVEARGGAIWPARLGPVGPTSRSAWT